MFVRLGIKNILRQWTRSTLALVCLALAAISLTTSLSLSQGYPAQAYSNYRHYLGGDIVVYPLRFLGGDQSGNTLDLYRLSPDYFSTLTTFFPHLISEGFLAGEAPSIRPLSESELAAVLQHPEVTVMRPIYRMPVVASLGGKEMTVPVRALAEDDPLFGYLQTSAKRGLWLNRRVSLPEGQQLPRPGEMLTLKVPRTFIDAQGNLATDYVNLVSIELPVSGYYELPTRSLAWTDPSGAMMTEQAYLDLPEIWLTEDLWMTLWSANSELAPQALSYGVSVRNLGVVESVASELQLHSPAATVISAPNLARLAQRRPLIDHFVRAPQELWAYSGRYATALPQDMGAIIALILYANVGLLLAARALTGLAARRKEIAVLKALGARRREIMQMALSESVTLSLIGATVGFALSYVAVVFQQISNQVAWASIVGQMSVDYLIVLAITTLIALVFGLWPAWRLSRLTVMEVLR